MARGVHIKPTMRRSDFRVERNDGELLPEDRYSVYLSDEWGAEIFIASAHDEHEAEDIIEETMFDYWEDGR